MAGKHLYESEKMGWNLEFQEVRDRHNYNKCKFVLVKSISELKSILNTNTNTFIALDTETTSLSAEHGDLVGLSFCFDGFTGYYVPLKHSNFEHNLNTKQVLDILVPHLLNHGVYFFNVMFDIRFLEWQGYDLSDLKFIDVAMSAWECDTNQIPSLKKSEALYLNWKPIEFNELVPKKSNLTFADLKPTDKALEYACVDAIGTFVLGEWLKSKTQDFNDKCTIKNATHTERAGSLDHLFLYPLMKMSNEQVLVDVDKLVQDSVKVKGILEKIDAELQEILGQGISLNGGKTRNDRLVELGIETDDISDKGAMSFSSTALEKALSKYTQDSKQYKIISLLLERAKYSKLSNTFYANLMSDVNSKGEYVRFNYNTTTTNTGRLSASGSGKPTDAKYNPFFANLNIQQMPKPHSLDWYVHEGYSDRESDINIEGYYFSTTAQSDKVIESKNPDLNIRNLFIADEDEYWVSFDYAAEELRILGNLTGDLNWADAFNSGQDFHEKTAKLVWGEENYNADYRKKAKAINFSLAYGGGVGRIAETTGTDFETARDMFNTYMDANQPLKNWWSENQRRIQYAGDLSVPYVVNPFGFYRQLLYEKEENRYTTIMKNTPIQSTAAYILKRDIVLLYRELLSKPEYKDKIRFQTTVHDEFNFVIKKDYALEMIKRVLDIMYTKFDGWNIPLVADFEIGKAWGNLFPFKIENNKLVPILK